MTAAGFGYASAVLLAVFFAVAAAAKVRDPKATVTSFAGLGLPRSALLAQVVPAVEAVIAVLLVAAPVLGAPAALVTLAFFTTFLVTRLRAGVRAPCACFGSISDAPLSVANLVGNGFLILLSMAALFATGPQWPTAVDAVVVVGAVAAEIAAYAAVRRAVAPA